MGPAVVEPDIEIREASYILWTEQYLDTVLPHLQKCGVVLIYPCTPMVPQMKSSGMPLGKNLDFTPRLS